MNFSTEIDESVILLGDTHFGVKRFSIDILKDQINFLREQVYPKMEELRITSIVQLGDLFDNRTTTDINFLNLMKSEFFDDLKERGYTLYSLVGNHDIYYKESRDVSLVNFFSESYDNFILFSERTYISINGHRTYIVPWITKGEELTYDEIKDSENILGHFEIRDFELVKGHMDSDSKLTSEFFTNNTEVRNVFSGHYHIKNTNGLVKYLGTPWQLNYGDYREDKGFYVWDGGENLEFYDNISSKKHIKIKYDDSIDKPIEISGLMKEDIYLSLEELTGDILSELSRNKVKTFINKSSDTKYEELLYELRRSNIETTVINNDKLSRIIGIDYIDTDIDISTVSDTKKFILDKIKESRDDKELIDIMLGIFTEVERTNKKG